MNLSNRYRWFTLIEMLLAITWFFLIMVIVLSAYIKISDMRNSIDARQNLIQESYFALEKLNILLRDFTIDYEEYFNRSMVGCDTNTWDFSRDVWDNWYCDLFTNYWNTNNILTDTSSHEWYYCSSQKTQTGDQVVFTWNDSDWIWCAISGYQSFGQYRQQFRDMKWDTNGAWVVNDDDDMDMWIWPFAILNYTWVKELYLISQDGTQRVFFRRALVWSWDRDWTWWISWDTEKRYNLQVLKLRWFDAWNNHDFDVNNSSWVYDGFIDTWACDYSLWFQCSGSWVEWWYNWYNLPSDSDDWRANMFPKNITISDRNLIISPTKNPQYIWKEWLQINPYFTVSIQSKLYWEIRQRRLKESIDNFELSLQTTLSTKNFYTK